MSCRHDNHDTAEGQSYARLGVVSYLNAKPLICGLQDEPSVRLFFDVPSGLCGQLLAGRFDAALIPVIDLLQAPGHLRVISDACIGSDGETLTVRVFSKVPPQDIRSIRIDHDSHTSVVLAKLLWPALFQRQVTFCDDSADPEPQAVLLIGDKVVTFDAWQYRYQVDLGGAWKTWTGLPFVFAVWAAPRQTAHPGLGNLLSRARDRGVRQAGQIAVEHGPAHGWPVALAQQYLQRYLRFGLSDKHVEGMIRFLDLARANDLVTETELQIADGCRH